VTQTQTQTLCYSAHMGMGRKVIGPKKKRKTPSPQPNLCAQSKTYTFSDKDDPFLVNLT